MRTIDEIVEYYRLEQSADFFGFVAEVLFPFLPFDKAKEWLKEDATAEEWGEVEELTRESVLEWMRDYMEFAWSKARNHRGLSAGRSVDKMRAWLWLLGDDELVTFASGRRNYSQYGVPILKAICEKYDFPMPADKGVERMAQGLPCCRDCNMGCGR